MDKKLIEKYGEEILCYRLRTARQKKRAQHKGFEKHLIHLYEEERTLMCQQQALGWEPLIPPVQKGWKRFFVLREDVARSKDANFFAGILARINTYDWHPRRDFLVKKRTMGRKGYLVKTQYLYKPYDLNDPKLSFTEAEKRFFDIEYHWNGHTCHHYIRYAFSEPWRFVLRIRPNIIDKMRLQDTLLEKRLKEIKNYLERNGYWEKQYRLMKGRSQWWRHNKEERYQNWHSYLNWPLSRIIEETKEEVYNE
jgi:hypothetical protein